MSKNKNSQKGYIYKSLYELNSINSSTSLFRKSFLYLLPKKGKNYRKQCIKIILFLVISAIIVFNLFFSNKKVSSLKNIISLTNTIDLVLLGLIFTGFSLFQAVLNKSVLASLVKYGNMNKEDSESFVDLYKGYYFLMCDFLINIFVNYLLTILLDSVKGKLLNYIFENYFCLIYPFIIIYIFVSLTVIYELKYFIFNLFSLYNLRTVSDIIEITKETKKSKFQNPKPKSKKKLKYRKLARKSKKARSNFN